MAIECQGGIWTQGRHTRGKGYLRDVEKRNIAASMGWAWFEITSDMLSRDPAGAIVPIIATIKQRMAAMRRDQSSPARRRPTRGDDE